MEPDDMPFPTPTFPNPTGIQDEYFPIEDGVNGTGPVYIDQNMLYQCTSGMAQTDSGIIGYNDLTGYDDPTYETFGVQDHIDEQAAMGVDMYAQISTLGSPSFPLNYLLPASTSFPEVYDMHMPLQELKPIPSNNQGPNNTHLSHLHTPREIDSRVRMQSQTPRSCPAPRLRPSPNRKPVFQSLQSSMALGMGRLRRRGVKRDAGPLSTVPSHIRVQREAEKKCEWDGCNKRFQRQEHLKRHEKTHTKADLFSCQFCGKNFGRSDNLKSHTKLHIKQTPRTKFFPEAQRVYDEMNRKPRKATTANKKPKPSVKSRL
jgi:zinc finger protein BrlA